MSEMIAYLRVSTDRQGRSGLGLDAQREAIRRFAEAEKLNLASEHVEVETGKGADALTKRPQLRVALDKARKLKCPIVVAKLDRLSRDVVFIAGLMVQTCAVRGGRAGARHRPVHPAHLCRAQAQKERAMISVRTKAGALARAKAKGARLGNPRLHEVRGKGAASMKAVADRFAANVLPLIEPLRAEGRSLREIANALNARGVPTARGGKWAPTQIADILKRAG